MHERVLFWRARSVPHFRPPVACKSSLRTKDLVARAVPLTSGALSEATSYARRCCGFQGRMPDGAPIFPTPGTSSAEHLANRVDGSAGRPCHSKERSEKYTLWLAPFLGNHNTF